MLFIVETERMIVEADSPEAAVRQALLEMEDDPFLPDMSATFYDPDDHFSDPKPDEIWTAEKVKNWNESKSGR